MNTQPTVEELWALLQEQRAEIAQLKEQLNTYHREASPLPNKTETEPAVVKRRLSRGGLLKAAAAGIAGLAVAEVEATAGAPGASASQDFDDVVRADGFQAAWTMNDTAFYTGTDSKKKGVDVYGKTVGVQARSGGVGVEGQSDNGSTTGVYGWNSTGHGWGVIGRSYANDQQRPDQLGDGLGVEGNSGGGIGVKGTSTSGTGVWAESGGVGVRGISSGSALTGVYGVHTANDGTGVAGVSFADSSQHALGAGVGVVGESGSGIGVRAISQTGIGVRAMSETGIGLSASSDDAHHAASYGFNTASGWGVIGRSYATYAANQLGTGIGVEGNSGSGTGVKGTSVAGGVGVAGVASSDPQALGSGIGVSGESDRGPGVWGKSGLDNGVVGITTTSGTGPLGNPITNASLAGVYGMAQSPAGHGYGVIGRSWNSSTNHLGDGLGVMGESGRGIGVLGSSTAGSGITGTSSTGRGGIFAGGAAQIQLTPSATAATHPATGQAGDLFVDQRHRLWYCQGGTHWKQLA